MHRAELIAISMQSWPVLLAKLNRKKKWMTSKEAADILTSKSGHVVSDTYVQRLGNIGLLMTDTIDRRTKLYLRADMKTYTVKQRGTGEIRRAISEK